MKFFTNDETKEALKWYIEFLKDLNVDEEFEKQIVDDSLQLLNIMRNASGEWDKYTSFNIKEISGLFISELKDRDIHKKNVHLVYALAIRFLNEFYMTTDMEFHDIYHKIKDNAWGVIDKINSLEAKRHLRFAFNGMPLDLVKEVFNHEGMNVFQNYTDALSQADKLKKDWDNLISQKETEVKRLEEALVRQKHSYQFVQLNKGFQSLLEQKESQLSLSRITLLILGFILPASIIFEMVYWLGQEQQVFNQSSLFKFVPALSLTLILVYYFRIALQNYQSIKAQILQIEFRMTLCGFIQSYAEYSSNIKAKNPNSLSKFEDVIFSNIMTSEDKIPSTFDGIEQISTLITSLKGSRDSNKS